MIRTLGRVSGDSRETLGKEKRLFTSRMNGFFTKKWGETCPCAKKIVTLQTKSHNYMRQKLFTILLLLCATMLHAQTVRIEDQKIVLTHGGRERVIAPQGIDASYYWVSLSTDKRHLLYSTATGGTFTCTKRGHFVKSIGVLNAPRWMGNHHVAGWFDPWPADQKSGYYIMRRNGKKERFMTDKEKDTYLRMEQKRLAANADEINRREERRVFDSTATSLSDLRFYLNPGHGGYNANDRSAWTIPVPETWRNPEGYWESKANLQIALHLRNMLEEEGAGVIMSRTENLSGTSDMAYMPIDTKAERQALLAGGDRSLSAIAEEASANKVDQFISIHGNAYNGKVNYLLVLYHGTTDEPTIAASRQIATQMGNELIQNSLTAWTNPQPMIFGDFTFYNDRSGLGVLRPLTVPGVLVEMSFYDCPAETHRYMSDDYCRISAYRLFNYLCRYYHRPHLARRCICGDVKSACERVDTLGHKEFVYKAESEDQWLPINGAQVQLLNQEGHVLRTTTTDQWFNGVFAFYDILPGEYTLRITAEGYQTQEQPMTITEAAADYIQSYPIRMGK